MTTSSETRNSPAPAPRPSGDHWFEMTAVLVRHKTDAFDLWVSDSLASLEDSLARFSSPRSRGESESNRG